MTTTRLNTFQSIGLGQINTIQIDGQKIIDDFNLSQYINPQIDYEVKQYGYKNISNIVVNLDKNLSDFGYQDTDLKTMSNRLTKSKLIIYYYNDKVKSKRQLVYRQIIPFSYFDFFDGDKPKDLSDCDIVFKASSPKIVLPNKLFSETNTIYASFRFFSAVDGNIYVLTAKDINNNLSIFDENDFVVLERDDLDYVYDIADRDISIQNNTLSINLYLFA